MNRMRSISEYIKELKPIIAMLIYQTAVGGSTILYKMALDDGMSSRVLIAYRFLISAIFLSTLALIFESNKRPKLTPLILWHAFLSGLLWFSLAHNLYATSIKLTSATFASTMFNLVPAVTFILAVSFGLERLDLKTMGGKAKVVGTVVSVVGAMTMTVFKGMNNAKLYYQNIWLGAILIICDCFSGALGLIVQASLIKEYPPTYSGAALMTLMGAIQSFTFAIFMERSNWSRWRLGWNVRLLAVLYNGLVASGVAFILAAWCVKVKGPLFVSIFSPFMLVVVAAVGSFVLNEKLHIGSGIGAIILTCGLYMVIWGKSRDLKHFELDEQQKPVRSEGFQKKINEITCGQYQAIRSRKLRSTILLQTPKETSPKLILNTSEGQWGLCRNQHQLKCKLQVCPKFRCGIISSSIERRAVGGMTNSKLVRGMGYM